MPGQNKQDTAISTRPCEVDCSIAVIVALVDVSGKERYQLHTLRVLKAKAILQRTAKTTCLVNKQLAAFTIAYLGLQTPVCSCSWESKHLSIVLVGETNACT